MKADTRAPISMQAIAKDWPRFQSKVRRRLLAGAKKYGDASFKRSRKELKGEMEAEFLDIMGWGFIYWTKLQKLAEQIDRK